MLSISDIQGASYLLDGGSGCGAHAHAHLPSAYAMDAVMAGDPPGVWSVRGENTLDLVGQIVPSTESAEAYRLLFDKLQDPTRKTWVEHEDGGGEWVGAQLGQPLARYKSLAEKVRAWRRKHPTATPEQLRSYKVTAQKKAQHAIHGWDLTFSPAKSWSVVHAAFEKAGRREEAQKLQAALEHGVHAALDYAFEHGIIQTRKGTPGPKVGAGEGRSTTEYLEAKNAIIAVFMHHVSRERDPQIHWHASLLNRLQDEDGTWRAIYSPALTKNKHMLDAIFEASAEAEAERTLGFEFVSRPDGVGREIAGVDLETIEFFSSRSRKMSWLAEELVDAFRAKYGAEPPARIRWQMLQHANKAKRPAKMKDPPPREEELERFEASLRAKTQGSLFDVLDDVDSHRVWGGVDQADEARDLDRWAVIAQALADLGLKKGTASESQLMHALHLRLPDDLRITAAARRELLVSLTEQAQASGEAVSTRAKPLAEAPPSLRNRRTGRSRFEAPVPRRFTTRTHLAREDGLVARLDKPSPIRITREQVATRVASRGAGRDQADAVMGVLSSGRFIDTIEAPAGSGKSFTLKLTSDVLEELIGVGLTVFTLSEIASEVVRGEGIERAHNVPRFIAYKDRQAAGETDLIEDAEFALPEGGVIAVDEATMLDTPRMARLVEEAEAAGVAKIVVVGDTAQTDAVDAGGAFAMLVGEVDRREREHAARERAARRALMAGSGGLSAAEQVAAWTGVRQGEPQPVLGRQGEAPSKPASELTPAKVHRLTEVRRFTWAWEKQASTDLRAGKVEALAEYEIRGRLRGFFDEGEMYEAAAKGFVDDHLSGRRSIMVTGTGEEASRASGVARRLLAAHGHVEEHGVELRDHNQAGVGDLIQTRLNDKSIEVTNRKVWQVVGRVSTGALEVQPLEGRRDDGEPVWGRTLALPPVYVRTQVELAYASTVEGFQGATVDTGHDLVGRSMGRSQYYPAHTRGRLANTSYVHLAQTPEIGRARSAVTAIESRRDQALTAESRASAEVALVEARRALAVAEGRGETAVGRLAQVLSSDDHVQAARVEMQLEEAREKSLAHLGPQWEAGVRETRAASHRGVLVDGLGADAERVLEDPVATRLYTLLREAELRGHEPAKVLERVMHHRDGRWRDLGGVDSPASALYTRIKDDMKVAAPTRAVPMTFESRVPATALGDPQNAEREFWRVIGRGMDDRVAAAAQELADAPEPWAVRALGPVPDDPVARGGWIGRAAYAVGYRERYGYANEQHAIGRRPDHLQPEQAWWWDLAARQIGMPDHQRDLEAQPDGVLLNRVQDWARLQGLGAPVDVAADLGNEHAALREAQARIVAARSLGQDTAEHEAARALHEGRVRVLEETAEHRAAWVAATREPAQLAEDAQAELDRRGELDRARDGVPLPPEPDHDPEFDDPIDDDPFDDVGPDVSDEERWAAARAAAFDDWKATAGIDGPRFGSGPWVALADDDPAKWAAVTAAAHRAWNLGAGLDRDRIYAELDQQKALDDAGPALSAVHHGPDLAPVFDDETRTQSIDKVTVPVPADDRVGDLVSDEDQVEIAREHAADELAEVVGDEPDDVLPVLEWAQARLTGQAPGYATPEYADLPAGHPLRDEAQVAAAMDVWNLGDDLGELQARTLGPVPVEDQAGDDEFVEPDSFDQDVEPLGQLEEPALSETTKASLLEAARAHAAEVEATGELVTPEPEVVREPDDLAPEEPDLAPETGPEPVVDVDAQYQADLEHARAAREVFDVPAPHEPELQPEPLDYVEAEPDLETVDDY